MDQEQSKIKRGESRREDCQRSGGESDGEGMAVKERGGNDS